MKRFLNATLYTLFLNCLILHASAQDCLLNHVPQLPSLPPPGTGCNSNIVDYIPDVNNVSNTPIVTFKINIHIFSIRPTNSILLEPFS